MKVQRKREDVWDRFCDRKKVNGQGEGTGYSGRNPGFPVSALGIATHPVCSHSLLIKHWVTFLTFYYEKISNI